MGRGSWAFLLLGCGVIAGACGSARRDFDPERGSSGSGETAGAADEGGASGEAGTSGSANEAGGSGEAGATGEAGAVGDSGTGGAPTAAGNGGSLSGGTGAGGGGGGGGGTSAGQGGTPPAGGGGAGGAAPVVDTTLTGAWDGALVQYACGSSSAPYDCVQPASANCLNVSGTATAPAALTPSNGALTTWTMGGDANTTYAVTFRIRGVVEVKYYPGGVRLGPASVLTTPRNLFQEGGTVPTENTSAASYNTYQLNVTPPVQGLPNQAVGRPADVYYLNSVAFEENPGASNVTIHKSFDIDYSATIKVKGGGTVAMSANDSNCHQIQNCGDLPNTCAVHRTVDLSGASPAAPAFVQPLSTNGAFGQWVFFDVTGVAVSP